MAFALLDEPDVIAKWDVPPQQIGDVLALSGDSVDNIPGAGIGRKTAATLIREHGELKTLLNNLDQMKSERTPRKTACRARPNPSEPQNGRTGLVPNCR